MMKPAALMGLIVVAALAFAVFQVEHKVQTLKQELQAAVRNVPLVANVPISPKPLHLLR